MSLRETGQWARSTSRRCNPRYALLVVPDGQLEVTGDDTLLLVIARGVARELEDLSSQVLKHRRHVDWEQHAHVSPGATARTDIER